MGLSLTFNSQSQYNYQGSYNIILQITTDEVIGESGTAEYQEEVDKIINDSLLTQDEKNIEIEKLKEVYKLSTYNKTEIFILDSKELTANPYQLKGDFLAKKLFDISKVKNIQKIAIYVHLDQGLKNDDYIDIKNIELSFGYLTSKYSQEELNVYTIDGDTYSDTTIK